MSNVTERADHFIPPRKGKVLCIQVDTTTRNYDLTTIDLMSLVKETKQTLSGGSKKLNVFLTLEADGPNVYFLAGPDNSVAVDETAKVTAGATLAFTANACAMVPSGGIVSFDWDRMVDKFLAVKVASGAANCTLRIWASSHRSDGQGEP